MSNGNDGWGDDPNTLDMTDVHGDEDLAGSPRGPADGVYHLYADDVDESRAKVDAIKIKFVVLKGTVPGQEGKSFVEDFFDPKASQKDGGKFCLRKRIRLAKALGLITPANFGQKVAINWQDAKYRQVVAAVETYEREANGKKYSGSQVANGGMDLWGPRDDEAAGCPLDEDALLAAAEVQLNAAPRAQSQQSQQTPQPVQAQPQALAANPPTNATAPATAPAASSAPPPPAPPRRPSAPAGAADPAGAGGAVPVGAGAGTGTGAAATDPYSGI